MSKEEVTVAYVIAEPCIGVKDTACVDACPVDCIHPKKNTTYEDGRPGFEEVPQLYIDPVECCVAVRRYAAESSFLFFTSETLSMRIMDSDTTKRL